MCFLYLDETRDAHATLGCTDMSPPPQTLASGVAHASRSGSLRPDHPRLFFSSSAFRKFNIERATVMTERENGRSRGFGFVTFAHAEDMERSIREMHDSQLDGRTISVRNAVPQSAIAPGTRSKFLGSEDGTGDDGCVVE